MAEANDSVHQAKLHASMGSATITLAKHRAIKATKADLKGRGLKPTHLPHRDIVVLADQYLAQHRAELVAEARAIVDRWLAEGRFGRASVRKVPELRTLAERNGVDHRRNRP
jgi:hypothetical protein